MPPDAPGPFAFADRARIERVLGTAGFRDATVTALDADVCMAEHGLDEAVEYATHAGPAARRLAEASDAQRAAVTEAVREALAPQVRDGRVTLRGAAWVVTARA
jgi:hypothetical protein